MIKVLESPVKEYFSDTEIEINGAAARAELCRVSALPFNMPWQGRQRPLSQTEAAGFLRIVADEPVNVKVRLRKRAEKFTVRPLSENISVTADGGEVGFTLSRAGQYVFEAGDEHGALHIFVDEPRDFAEYGTPTRVFGKGLHDAGKITLKDGDRIFLDEGAHVKGVIYGKNVRNAAVYGYGVLDGGAETRDDPNCYGENPNGCFKLYECENVKVDGVTFIDSAVWVCNLFACRNVTIDDVKIVGHWKYNCDGVDIVNSSHITVRDSFVRAFDDVITLKGILPYRDLPVSDITVENCVLWCGWGRTLEIGLETLAEEYRDISFTDCDLIHNSAVAMDIQCGDYAEIRNVLYKDIRTEFQSGTLPEQFEDPPGCEYTGRGKRYTPTFIKICSYEYFLGKGFEEYDRELKAVRAEKSAAFVHGVVFDGITVYLEDGCASPSVVFDMKPPGRIGDISVKDLRILKV